MKMVFVRSGAICAGLVATLLVASGCSTAAGPKSAPDSSSSASASDLVGVDPAVFNGLSGSISYYDGVGGAPGKIMVDTGFKQFTDLSGVEVKVDPTDNTLTKFMAASEAGGGVPWSIVDVGDQGEMLRAKQAGYLQKLDPKIVPLDNVLPEFRDDYMLPVGTTSGVVITWNTDVFPLSGEHPTSTKDFFDLKKFPGKRCLHNTVTGEGTLELALYADGVAPEDIFPLDVDRALKKLESVADDTIWIGGGYDGVIQGLLNGTCVMTWAPEGRAFIAVSQNNAPLAIGWDGAFFWTGYMAIPKGAPNPEAAQAALALWASSKEANMALANGTSYINRLNILAETDYPAELRDWLPLDTRPNAINDNGEYWMNNVQKVQKKFSAWVAAGAGK
ncbi:extracellular solute-binding protein [Glutamicibacter protophormiae]|uniref:extracellular solute-binding protein n=1 Tax=Glutamicibacter protophormiae TaxID=37930 RepID=UPI003A90C7EF